MNETTNTISTSGLFGSNYKINYTKYTGHDYSKFSVMFPGLGSSFERVYSEMFKKSSAFRNRAAQADVINQKNGLPLIADLMSNNELTEGNEAILPIKNVLYFVFQVSIFDVLRQFSLFPNMICGHSFGEFAGMTSAGLLPFETTLELVQFREKLIPPTESMGSLVAIRMDDQKVVEFATNHNLKIANINSDNQAVIAFTENEREQVKKILKSNKVSHIFLNKIKQPYHSPILADKAQLFKQYIIDNNIKFQKPNYSYFSFVENRVINASNFENADVAEIISGQLVKPVLFKKVILEQVALNIFTFIEVGFDSILNDLVFDIKNTIKLKTITLKDLLVKRKILNSTNKKILEIENSKFARVVLETIQRVTGYSVEQISIEDSFQESLGIDSIKKAEIIYEILKNTNQNLTGDLSSLSNIKNISDVVAYLETSAASDKTIAGEIWEEFKPEPKSIFENYSFNLKVEPYTTAELKLSNNKNVISLTQLLNKSPLEIVDDENFVVLKNDLTKNKLSAEINTFNNLLITLREFFKTNEAKLSTKKLVLESQNENDLFAIILDPFFRSLRIEMIFSNFFHINLKNERITPILASPITEFKEFNFSNSKILAIGGSKGIGFSLLSNLLTNFTNIELTILGRSSLEANPTLTNRLAELSKLANKQVIYKSVDAKKMEDLEQAILAVNSIDYIFNFTGEEFSQKFLDKENTIITRELESKILPCLNVKNITKKHNINSLNFHQSSYVSLMGNEGQSIYALANTLINQMADAQNRVTAWPAWNNIGMTERKEVNQRLDFIGVQKISEQDAFTLFKRNNSHNLSFLFNKHDTLLFKLGYLNKYEVGELSRKQSGKYFLKKIIDVNQAESFLKGHIYNDTVPVSMSYLLASIIMLGEAFDFQEIYIEHFRMRNALIIPFNVNPQRELNLILNHATDPNNSLHESLDIRFFENIIVSESLIKSHTNLNFNLEEFLLDYKIPSRSIKIVFYSKEFANLKTFIFQDLFVMVNKLEFFPENKNLYYGELKLINSNTNDYYSSKFLRILQLFEGALQVCSTHTDRQISIPQYISRATINLKALEGELFKVYIKIFKRDEVLFHCNIAILNDKNELVTYMDEVVKSIIKTNA